VRPGFDGALGSSGHLGQVKPGPACGDCGEAAAMQPRMDHGWKQH